MQFEEALQFYKQQRRKILAQHFADFIISWDMQTDAAPQSISADAEYGAVLSEYSYELVSDEKFVAAVETLDGNRQLLDDVLCHEVEVMKKTFVRHAVFPRKSTLPTTCLFRRRTPCTSRQRRKTTLNFSAPTWKK